MMRGTVARRLLAERAFTRPGNPTLFRRWKSTQAPLEPKPVSPHISIYQTFGRPVAKVLLMATFIYQVTYWGWVYLENEEIKAQKSAEIEALEAQLEELTKNKQSTPP